MHTIAVLSIEMIPEDEPAGEERSGNPDGSPDRCPQAVNSQVGPPSPVGAAIRTASGPPFAGTLLMT